ncbi:MAG: heavy-metal-associated domain-containing protein [Methylobacterium sp.]|uniref:heavy-metal-associated domain-containing protein n=1 Tax=Methylobacterium sp. TaxID=409 RepID=UPI0025F2356C|nr:heavy-metal-associated domain-containing protein [Methylobacterium sp.]MBX9933472.1 heavy-metal-associated domain-containing protein [Methylobacterium sp.]
MIPIKVTKMNCGGCAKAVTRAVQGVDPAARVEIDLKSGQVSIMPGTAVAAERFADAIRAAGFGAETGSLAA